ncbi:hypothetical protein EV644_103104 [Kribbella orskensis]|uniref:EthD domain-containing protein n=1 Tax=Kribbella orskensis TaxID=2512216 RepID=A0ABY2BRM4_9ACTN|nr:MULTISPECIES: DUF6308 family protein [Kribbella]TCN39810.1 hypothetical protein EV642_106316 [Kribbella sp. VKM Ac-2500]TCO27407.1 hypothetical protein EV644_103104 [Kribbella orskensis]
MTRSIGDLRNCADVHLARYLDPDHRTPRAFHAYDGPGEDPDPLTALDMLAPVLLSVRLTYADILPMFAKTGHHRDLRTAMEAVLTDPACRNADFLTIDLDNPRGPWARVRHAFEASYPVHNIKVVKVSKILHRKRPKLVPIYDRELYRYYVGPPTDRWTAHQDLWPLLQADLRVHQEWLTQVTARHQPENAAELTLLRAADIVVWEHQVAPTSACTDSA